MTKRPQPITLAAKAQVEATLHASIVDFLLLQNQLRFAYGARMGDRVRRLISSTQALLDDVEKRPPDTSQREEPPL